MKTVRFSMWSSLLLMAGFALGLSACGTTNNGAALGTSSMTTWNNDQVLQTYISLNQGEVLTSQPLVGADTVNIGTGADTTMGATPDMNMNMSGMDTTNMNMSGMDTTNMNMDMDMSQMDMSNMNMSDVDTPEEFAQMMVAQHGQAIQQAVALAGDTDLQTQANPVSQSLNNTAQNIASKLRTLSGNQLDMQYMQDQITLHQNALQMLDNTLIPHATDDELRQMLQQGRQVVASHLQIAQRIVANMQNQGNAAPDSNQ